MVNEVEMERTGGEQGGGNPDWSGTESRRAECGVTDCEPKAGQCRHERPAEAASVCREDGQEGRSGMWSLSFDIPSLCC